MATSILLCDCQLSSWSIETSSSSSGKLSLDIYYITSVIIAQECSIKQAIKSVFLLCNRIGPISHCSQPAEW